MVKRIAIGAVGVRFESRVDQIRHSVAIPMTFLRSCVVQALSRGDDLRRSLHASA